MQDKIKICKAKPRATQPRRDRERERGSENNKNSGPDLGNTGRRAGAGRAADTHAVMNHMSPARGKNARQVPRRPDGGEAGRVGRAGQREDRRRVSEVPVAAYLAAPSTPESSMPEHLLPIVPSITIWGQLITRDPATRPSALGFASTPPHQMFSSRPSGSAPPPRCRHAPGPAACTCPRGVLRCVMNGNK